MEGKRPKRVKTEPMARHVDGHTLKAMGGLPGQGCPLRRTAELEDYGPAHPMAVTFNKEALDNGENSGFLKESGAWIDKQGVAIVQLEGELDSKQVVIELDERFKDGKLSFAAKDQIAEYHTVKGGWAEEYKNVLKFSAQRDMSSRHELSGRTGWGRVRLPLHPWRGATSKHPRPRRRQRTRPGPVRRSGTA